MHCARVGQWSGRWRSRRHPVWNPRTARRCYVHHAQPGPAAPELLGEPAPPRLMPHPPADETFPLLVMAKAVPAAPSMPSLFVPVEVIALPCR